MLSNLQKQGTLKDVTQTNVFKLSNILCYVTVRKAFRGQVGQLFREETWGASKSIFVRKDTLYNANRID